VGIRLAHLTGDEDFSLYAAALEPQVKVGAHYHRAGLEIYQIVEGSGTMYLGQSVDGKQVEWNVPFAVKSGDCFTVHACEVHQLINSGDDVLVVIFGCSTSHTSTDRIVVPGIREGGES
jgi:mannose-6-phosphate isomerase-like protein (cupin superfamily)